MLPYPAQVLGEIEPRPGVLAPQARRTMVWARAMYWKIYQLFLAGRQGERQRRSPMVAAGVSGLLIWHPAIWT
jgi:hypothetical protein